jgi:hypothetical protein|tara:strand:- start:751 stop:930 length:180 start_codon:yes stop_codon:yes gene_type:complete
MNVTVMTEARPAQNTFFSSFVMYELDAAAVVETAKAGIGRPMEQAMKQAMNIGIELFWA